MSYSDMKSCVAYNKTCNEQPANCIFRFEEYRQGETFNHGYEDAHYIVYCSRGVTRLKSNLFKEEMIYGGEILFLPRMADCWGEVMEDSHTIIHTFNNSICIPENCILSYLYNNNGKEKAYTSYCCKLPSHKVLDVFMESISIYLVNRTASLQLWRIKHCELIHLFSYYYSPDELRTFFHPMIGEHIPFKSLVITHYRKANQTKELARLCGYPLSTFRRIFKKEFNVPAYQWLIEKRAEHILHRLRMEHITLTDIMDEFNFSSAQHFNSFCKKYLGDTPGNLRKNDQLPKNISTF